MGRVYQGNLLLVSHFCSCHCDRLRTILRNEHFTDVLHLTELETSFVKKKRGSSGLMQTDRIFSEYMFYSMNIAYD